LISPGVRFYSRQFLLTVLIAFRIMRKKIRPLIQPHSDLAIRWDSGVECSITPEGNVEGQLLMKYSSIPSFIYLLCRPMESLGFLGEKTRSDILSSHLASFAGSTSESIARESDLQAMLYRHIWLGNDGRKPPIQEDLLKKLRVDFGIEPVMTSLYELVPHINELDYLGLAPASKEYPEPIHIFSSARHETYLCQNLGGVNILMTIPRETEVLVGEICNLYGSCVSGALKGLIKPISATSR
jgi:hypothetical protein